VNNPCFNVLAQCEFNSVKCTLTKSLVHTATSPCGFSYQAEEMVAGLVSLGPTFHSVYNHILPNDSKLICIYLKCSQLFSFAK
jgi:hypothetical protein